MEKLCNCCKKLHTNISELTFVGKDEFGQEYYNCENNGCGSTLVLNELSPAEIEQRVAAILAESEA